MKKIITICLVLLFAATSVFATDLFQADLMGKRTESKSFSGDPAVGTIKLGFVGGYPSGVTLGWRTSDNFELNFVAATRFYDVSFGASALFTIADINISDQIFPLSFGPAVYISIPFVSYVPLNMDVLATIRWEYSFQQAPINLFIEAGFGVSIRFGSSSNLLWNSPIGFGYSGAAGIRYIF